MQPATAARVIEQIEGASDVDLLRAVREACDKRILGLGTAGRENGNYRLKQHLGRAMTSLRDAEDYARTQLPGWPTADRIRAIHQQVTDDVLNGRTSRPSLVEQAEQREQAVEALRRIAGQDFRGPKPGEIQIAEDALARLES